MFHVKASAKCLTTISIATRVSFVLLVTSTLSHYHKALNSHPTLLSVSFFLSLTHTLWNFHYVKWIKIQTHAVNLWFSLSCHEKYERFQAALWNRSKKTDQTTEFTHTPQQHRALSEITQNTKTHRNTLKSIALSERFALKCSAHTHCR